jgi:hypothetical protein
MKLVYKFYSKDIENLVTMLEKGIEVFSFPSTYTGGEKGHSLTSFSADMVGGGGEGGGLGGNSISDINNDNDNENNNEKETENSFNMVRKILWLEINEKKFSRSRICIASKDLFEFELGGASGDWEREMKRVSEGIALADIAEVRLGAASDSFRKKYAESEYNYDASLCFSIIGSERTIDVQLTSSDTASASSSSSIPSSDTFSKEDSSSNNNNNNNNSNNRSNNTGGTSSRSQSFTR